MIRSSCVTISVFIISILALSGVLYGQRVFDLDKVWGDMRVLGDDGDDYSGNAVTYGDINGDGFMDLIIGAFFATPGDPARTHSGETYVIFCSTAPLSTIDLSTQSADITVLGDDDNDLTGYAVASGDVNGDGYDDIIIGAYGAVTGDPALSTGATYVIFGDSFSSTPYTIDLSTTPADITVCGAAGGDRSGFAVASGDINGDGFDDIIIGAYYATPGGRSKAGETYVIFGASFSSPPYTIELRTQSADITVCGAAADDFSGWAVASGDVNNDGYDDVIIGAPFANPGDPPRTNAGETYVFFGSSFPSPPYTIDLNSQSPDITVCGNLAEDKSGCAVASGDVNVDGCDDLIIGAYWADPGDPARTQAGETYVIFGSSSPSKTIDLSTGSADLTIYGKNNGDTSGMVLTCGNINGDSYDDVIIGAANAHYAAGETYVIFGSSSLPATFDLSTQPANLTVYGKNTNDYSSFGLASGDINGDSYDDVIIGAKFAWPLGRFVAGETYVVFGESYSSPPYIRDLKTQSAEITVYGQSADDYSGHAVASGDVNGDGYMDIIIGAPSYPSIGNRPGRTHIIFGFNPTSSVTIDLNSQPADITIKGDDVDDYCGSALASGDINSDGYDDLIIGAPWADPGDPPRDLAGETYLIAGGGAFITAHGLGGKSWIKEFSLLANGLNSFKAFGAVNSQGEVHLALGNADADSLDEIVAGQGEGGKSWVKFFEVDASFISAFKAFGAANTNGEVHLTIGNFDAEPSDNEIAVAQGEGGQSWVKVFETDGTFIRSIKAFGAANAQGEIHLVAGDLENADGIDEIVAGMGEGGSSRVKIFSYDGTLIRSFAAFDATENPGGEVHLTVGNFDADADLEIAAATGYNGGNLVRLFDKDGTSIGEFTAFGFGGNTNGDVQITASDIDNDGIDELICGHGEGGVSQVKVFKADGTVVISFKAFGGVNAQGEVHLGKSNY